MPSPGGSSEGLLSASALGAGSLAGSMAGSQLNPAGSALRTLIGQKEKELHDMNEYRIQALEGAITERDRQILDLHANFKKLKVDFQYNLQLIEDRDSELERYDASFANLKNVLRDRDAETSDLKVSIDELEAQLRSERERVAQVENYSKDKLSEAKERLEGLRLQKDEELRKTRADMDEMRRGFLAQLSEKDELLNTQRRDMAASFDDLVRKQEHEASAREEALRAEVREAQAREHRQLEEHVKLEQEADHLRRETGSLRAEVEAKEAMLAGAKADADARLVQLRRDIDALHQEAAELSLSAQAREAELAARLREAERLVAGREHQMTEERGALEIAHRRALQDQDLAQRAQVNELEARCEILSSKLTTAENDRERLQQAWARATQDSQQQQVVHLAALEALQRKLDAAQTQVADLTRSAGLQRAEMEEELACAREKIATLKNSQEERRQDLEALRAQLLQAGEREETLQRKLAQAALRADTDALGTKADADIDAEGKVQERFSELLKSIGEQRDRAIADKEGLQEELNDALRQLAEYRKAHAAGTRPAHIAVEPLEADTPLDSPIQMPPFPDTPVPHNHNLHSRPTTADTDMWRSRPTTAEGARPTTAGGTRPGTAEGVREAAAAAAGVELTGRPRTGEAGDQGARAVAEARRLRVRLGEVEEQNQRLREVVAAMRSEMETVSGHKGAGASKSSGGGEHEDGQHLADRLQQTEAVLRRVTCERDKLISISNMLRADLKRAQRSSEREPLRAVQSSLASMASLDAFGAGDDDAARGGVTEGARVRREAWGDKMRHGDTGEERVEREEEDESDWRDVGGHMGVGGIEMVEMAMAELVKRNRQLKYELAQTPANQNKTGAKSATGATGVRKDRAKVPKRVLGSSLDGFVEGVHSYSQMEGDLKEAGAALNGGFRKKLERVRESLCLAGHSTAVKDRPGLVRQSERTTESQHRALTRVAMRAQTGNRAYIRDPPAARSARSYARDDV